MIYVRNTASPFTAFMASLSYCPSSCFPALLLLCVFSHCGFGMLRRFEGLASTSFYMAGAFTGVARGADVFIIAGGTSWGAAAPAGTATAFNGVTCRACPAGVTGVTSTGRASAAGGRGRAGTVPFTCRAGSVFCTGGRVGVRGSPPGVGMVGPLANGRWLGLVSSTLRLFDPQTSF